MTRLIVYNVDTFQGCVLLCKSNAIPLPTCMNAALRMSKCFICSIGISKSILYQEYWDYISKKMQCWTLHSLGTAHTGSADNISIFNPIDPGRFFDALARRGGSF